MPTVDQTITYLEMTAREQLVPARAPPVPPELEELDGESVGLAHSTYVAIGSPHHWVERPEWSPGRWRTHLARPEIRVWIARAEGSAAGMIELDLQADGAVEISVFGLVPEFVGRGLGGHLLTLAVRLAWEADLPGRPPTRRVWLHTSTLDHRHALRNYQARGFRVVRRVKRPRLLP
jgi:ribosomal protein S18 acetylase RimI-like enzyme